MTNDERVKKVMRVLEKHVTPIDREFETRTYTEVKLLIFSYDTVSVAFNDGTWTHVSKMARDFRGSIGSSRGGSGGYNVYAVDYARAARDLKLLTEKDVGAFRDWINVQRDIYTSATKLENLREAAHALGYEIRKKRPKPSKRQK